MPTPKVQKATAGATRAKMAPAKKVGARAGAGTGRRTKAAPDPLARQKGESSNSHWIRLSQSGLHEDEVGRIVKTFDDRDNRRIRAGLKAAQTRQANAAGGSGRGPIDVGNSEQMMVTHASQQARSSGSRSSAHAPSHGTTHNLSSGKGRPPLTRSANGHVSLRGDRPKKVHAASPGLVRSPSGGVNLRGGTRSRQRRDFLGRFA